MKITFALSFDSGAWPGPLDGRDHAAGEPWVGPLGMLSLLEQQLGLTAPTTSDTLRAAALLPALRATEGFWSESARVDPLGTARTLLRWRDLLLLCGWHGRPPGAPRLDGLTAVTAGVGPGVPDRLAAVAKVLRGRPVDIARVTVLAAGTEDLPPRWAPVFARLAQGGAEVSFTRPEAPGRAENDLGRCLGRDFQPAGDGTLQLLRSPGPLTAAEQVAAWLERAGDLEGTVVIGGDALLDDALRARGLPATGSVTGGGSELPLALLPLVLELAWAPQDPQTAMELLTLPFSPVPRPVRTALIGALREWPALDSDPWRAGLKAGLGRVHDRERRRVAQQRTDALLRPAGAGETIPCADAARRAEVLRAWMSGRIAAPDAEPEEGRADHVDRTDQLDQQAWRAAVAQCSVLLALLEASGETRLSRWQLRGLVRAATAEARVPPRHAAEAGIARVGDPASIAGPAPRVVWWNFTAAAAAGIGALPLDAAECSALVEAGAVLPDPRRDAERLGIGWRRPLEMTTAALLLVCPRLGPDGRETQPHPVFDEVSAHLSRRRLAPIEREEPIDLRRGRRLPLLPAPQPRWWWRPGGDVLARAGDLISPTSAGDLVACPLHWVLQRLAKLSPGWTAPLASGPLLAGSLAHHVLEAVLQRIRDGEALTAEQAAKAAGEIFDREGPRRAAEYFMPGAEADRAAKRRVIADAAGALAGHLREGGAAIAAIEETVEGDALGPFRFHGRCDLRLHDPAMIIDFKWARGDDRRDELARGAAYQLAAYAHLAAGSGPPPPVGYFITTRQRLLCSAGAPLGGEPVEGPGLRATWEGLRRAVEGRCKELRSGRVAAACTDLEEDSSGGADAAPPRPERNELAGGVLMLEPPCAYCPFQRLCHGEGA